MAPTHLCRACGALLVALGTGLVSLQAHAVGQLADVVIFDRSTGMTLPTYLYQGEHWVAGRPGASYAVEVRNRAGQRILAVPSVDGVNVLTGETAGFDQPGYVLTPGQRYQITGWRKSQSEVAAFEFTDASRSYAERTGRPGHVGVIGVALFRERPPVAVAPAPLPRPWPLPAPMQDAAKSSADAPPPAAAPAAPSAAAAAPPVARESAAGMVQESRSAAVPKLGTGHGARESSVVSHTQFERLQPQPQEIVRIRYDSRENLVAMGIIRDRPVPGPRPDAFPGSPTAGYVPDPPALR